MRACLRTEIVWVCFTIKPDSACAPLFVTMVTSPNIFEVVFPKGKARDVVIGTKEWALLHINNSGWDIYFHCKTVFVWVYLYYNDFDTYKMYHSL
jgi:hypothetical protein